MNLLLRMLATSASIRFGGKLFSPYVFEGKEGEWITGFQEKNWEVVIDSSIAYCKYFIHLFNEAVFKI